MSRAVSVDVRPASAQQADAIAALAARTFALACPRTASAADIDAFIATQLTADRFREYIADRDRRIAVAVAVDGDDGGAGAAVAVAERADSVVGYTMLVLAAPPADIARQLNAPDAVELSKIYVDLDRHGGSVAEPLLGDAVDAARAAGHPALWLGTNQNNVRAQRFYEKHGFLRVGTKRFRLGSRWEEDFVYERPL